MDQQQAFSLCGMDESLHSLIRLYCTEHPTEIDVKNWFAGVDIENLRPEVSCMAAAMSAVNDYNGVPLELIPRLQGILRYVHTLNSGMTAGLCALGKRYHESAISIVLLGSTAVHLRYPHPPQRHLWQAEISVSEADFQKAATLAEDAGFSVQKTPYSATARYKNTQCILIRKETGCTQDTTVVTVCGIPFQMPDRGELIVHMAETIFQLMAHEKPGAKLLPWIMDLHCVITTGTDWNSAVSSATERKNSTQVRLVLEMYNSLVPNIISTDILDYFGTADAVTRLANLLLEYRSNPGSKKLKRLWLSSRMKKPDSFFAAQGRFIKELGRSGYRKLTQKN